MFPGFYSNETNEFQKGHESSSQPTEIITQVAKLEESYVKTTAINTSTTHKNSTSLFKLDIYTNSPKFKCSVDEKPSNIGVYEVPTQRDFVLLIKETIVNLSHRYLQKAMLFLQDIKEATRAAISLENRCLPENKVSYRECMKHASVHSSLITKSLVKTIEKQKQEAIALLNVTICRLAEMKTDPIHFLKNLAAEEMTLHFALPGFLRLLSFCSSHCSGPYKTIHKKPLRKLTDQDIVVRYFLARDNSFKRRKNTKNKT